MSDPAAGFPAPDAARPSPAPSPAARPSPNIWEHPDLYELENRGVDPDGVLAREMRRIADWRGARVLDVGCGSGFHLPLFAADAARVVGVEPHPPLVAAARRRIAGGPGGAALENVEVVEALAQDLPCEDDSFDVAHARWAYFFGPGCEPGLAELERVMAPGGTAFVIDNDASRSTFGGWFRRQWPAYDHSAIERFWRRRGWQREPLLIRWDQPTRAQFEAVVGIEFDPALAASILREHAGTGVDYAVNLWWRRY